MSNYQHILVGLDLGDLQTAVLERALSLAGESTRLSLIHVVDMIVLPSAYMSTLPHEVQDQSIGHAKSLFKDIGEQHAIPAERQFVERGRPATRIHDVAKNHAVDLIVVGSQSRRGLRLLLGSTANAVVHGAPCDVLAVRV